MALNGMHCNPAIILCVGGALNEKTTIGVGGKSMHCNLHM